MADGREDNGGARENAGRKKKDVEDKAQKLSVKAMETVFGSQEECFEHTAKLAKGDDKNAASFPHLRLLFEYAYGKPPQEIIAAVDTQIEIIRRTITGED